MYKHTVYVPKHDNDRSEYSYLTGMDICKEITEHFALYYGGCTVLSGVGYYMMETDVQMDEVWTIYVVHSDPDIRQQLSYFIDKIKTDMKQESVLITPENLDAYFA
jgi:hypothetical protein